MITASGAEVLTENTRFVHIMEPLEYGSTTTSNWSCKENM